MLQLIVPLTKRCNACERELPFKRFGYLGGEPYLLDCMCVDCRENWYAQAWEPPKPIWLDPNTGAPRP